MAGKRPPKGNETPAEASHARVETAPTAHPTFPTPAERVDYCLQLMMARRWVRGKTDKELARAWGLAVDTVQGYSATAHQHWLIDIKGQRAEAAQVALDTLIFIAQTAAASDIPGDKSAARGAAKDLLEFAGIERPEEDKDRPQRFELVGQTIKSPVFDRLLGKAPKDGTDGESGTSGSGSEG